MPTISFFAPKTPPLLELPEEITRLFVPTPSGPLELLVARPQTATTNHGPPLFFAHGGCGGAAVWLEFMLFLAKEKGITSYALSYRGHGGSWYPSYLGLFMTSKRTFADDLVQGIKFVEQQEGGKKLVLVGHSSGGGLAQIVLDNADVQVVGLGLLAAIPGYGSWNVNLNWLRLDPLFNLRMLFHFGHPMSPLSSTSLVHRAFFCSAFPRSKVIEFERRMPRYESLRWPLGMLLRFVDFGRVVSAIKGWGTGGPKVLVMAGSEDKLMGVRLMDKLAQKCTEAYAVLVAQKKVEAASSKEEPVRFEVIDGAGHHLQNDLQWEKAAEVLSDWYSRL